MLLRPPLPPLLSVRDIDQALLHENTMGILPDVVALSFLHFLASLTVIGLFDLLVCLISIVQMVHARGSKNMAAPSNI